MIAVINVLAVTMSWSVNCGEPESDHPPPRTKAGPRHGLHSISVKSWSGAGFSQHHVYLEIV